MRRKLAPVLAAAALAGLGASAPAAHAVDCAGLNSALAAAPAGAVVTVDEDCPGMSVELPPRAITLEGAGDGVVLEGGEAGKRIVSGTDVGATTLRNLTLRGGTAPAGEGGGGLRLTGDSAPRLERIAFEGNAAPGGAGGGALIQSTSTSPIVLRDVTFASNTAGTEGAGLALDCAGPVRLENVVAAGNSGPGLGAGVRTAGCDVEAVHATVAGNEGSSGFALGAGDTLTLWNSIVAGNTGGTDLSGFSVGSTVRYSNVCTPTVPAGTGNVCKDPQLADPGPGAADVRQTQFSPSVDRGSAAFTPADLLADLEGDARTAGPVVDMGADEFTAPTALTSSSRSARPTSAFLTAAVNPNTKPTSYRFEYGRTAAYGRSTPTAVLPAGNSLKLVAREVRGLTPDRSYHFRVVATNASGTYVGLDKTFRTDPDTFRGVEVLTKSVTVKDGAAAVHVSCPRGSLATCTGTLRLATPEKVRLSADERRRVRLGSAPFAIPVRTSTPVSIALSRDARRALRFAGSLRTRATAKATNGFSTRTRRTRVTVKGKKRTPDDRSAGEAR